MEVLPYTTYAPGRDLSLALTLRKRTTATTIIPTFIFIGTYRYPYFYPYCHCRHHRCPYYRLGMSTTRPDSKTRQGNPMVRRNIFATHGECVRN